MTPHWSLKPGQTIEAAKSIQVYYWFYVFQEINGLLLSFNRFPLTNLGSMETCPLWAWLYIPWRHVPMTKRLKPKILQLRFLHLYHVIHTSSINQWITITSGELKTYQQHISILCHAMLTNKNIFPLILPQKRNCKNVLYMTFFRCTFPARFPPTPKTLVFSSARLSGGHHLWIPGDDDLRHAAPCRLIHLSPRIRPQKLMVVWTRTKIQRFLKSGTSSFHQTSMPLGYSCSFSGVESGWQQGYRTHKCFILGVNHLHV